jgi:GntR family transcriptional repressor for pyruvate dehydrogenase complex
MQPSLVETIVQRIRGLIEEGALAPGERIPSEPELAGRFQVSRTVLREAIGRLESIGLLDVRRGRGTFVGTQGSLSASVKLLRTALAFAPRDLRTVAEFRRGLEQEAARRAALRAKPEDHVELTRLWEEMDRHEVNTLDAMRADFRFHQKIVDLSGNELMSQVLSVLYEFVLAGMVQTPAPSSLKTRGANHRELLDTICAGDAEGAECAMREHMDNLEERLKEVEAAKTATISPS